MGAPPPRFSGTSIRLERVKPASVLKRTINDNPWNTNRKVLLALSGMKDFSYTATINVGGAPFLVNLDTGSVDLWIANQQCEESDCSGIPVYSPSPSLKNMSQPFNISYLAGGCSGFIGTETVRFAQFEVVDQTIALASHVRDLGLSSSGTSGMLGLAFPSISALSNSPQSGFPLMHNILLSLDDNQRFFAFRLGREVGNIDDDSTFFIGKHDKLISDLAQLHYIYVFPYQLSSSLSVTVENFDYWKIQLDGFLLNGQLLPLPLSNASTPSRIRYSHRPIAVFDTGTSLMLGPTSEVNAFYALLGDQGAPSRDMSGGWTVDCGFAIDMAVVLGGRAFPLHPLDLAWDKISTGGRCWGGLQANDNVLSGDWLFGDTVMRNIYTAHYSITLTAPPLLGLLSLTRPTNALQEFISARSNSYKVITDINAQFSDSILSKSFEVPLINQVIPSSSPVTNAVRLYQAPSNISSFSNSLSFGSPPAASFQPFDIEPQYLHDAGASYWESHHLAHKHSTAIILTVTMISFVIGTALTVCIQRRNAIRAKIGSFGLKLGLVRHRIAPWSVRPRSNKTEIGAIDIPEGENDEELLADEGKSIRDAKGKSLPKTRRVMGPRGAGSIGSGPSSYPQSSLRRGRWKEGRRGPWTELTNVNN